MMTKREKAITEYAYGAYRLELHWYASYVQVTMNQLGERFPMMWSMPMSREAAYGAKILFERQGYFAHPEEKNGKTMVIASYGDIPFMDLSLEEIYHDYEKEAAV